LTGQKDSRVERPKPNFFPGGLFGGGWNEVLKNRGEEINELLSWGRESRKKKGLHKIQRKEEEDRLVAGCSMKKGMGDC